MRCRIEVKIGDHGSSYGKERGEETGRKGKNEQLPENILALELNASQKFI
jgi:hypothetical protein